MKKPVPRRVLVSAILTAGALALSFASVWNKSAAAEVFAEASRSVVVVQAINFNDEKKRQGSGVVVGENEVVTTCQMIKKARHLWTLPAADFAAGGTYRMKSQVLARDNERGLCLLFVAELPQSSAVPMENIGAARGLSAGDEVYAIGALRDSKLSLTRGAVAKLLSIYGKRFAPLIQTDMDIPPSATGGGLFNDDGALVGITALEWKGRGLNFALPIEWLPDLREKGRPALATAQKRQRCVEKPDYECVTAVALAAAESIHNAITRVSVLNDIASAQAEMRDKQSARNTFDAAAGAARDMDMASIRDANLSKVASARAKAGDIDGAFAAIEKIDDEFRVRVLRDIASAQAEAGEKQSARETLAKALETARGIDDSSERARALLVVAAALTEMGERQSARNTLTAAVKAAQQDVNRYASLRAMDLRDIALAQARAGDEQSAQDTFAAAVAVAQGIRSEQARTKFLSKIESAQAKAKKADRAPAAALRDTAQAQAKAGNEQSAQDTFAAAVAAASAIRQPPGRAHALLDIAKAQVEAGDTQAARDTLAAALAAARDIDSSSFRANTLAGIALTKAEAGYIGDALAIAQSIDDPSPMSFAALVLREITAMQAQSGDIDGALAAARGIDDPSYRAEALVDIASAQTRAGDKQAARDTLAAALAATRGIDYLFDRDKALANIAQAKAKAGDIDGAFATVQGIDDLSRRATTMAGIASAQAQAGDKQSARDTLAAALDVTQSTEHPIGRVDALVSVVFARARMGDIDDALAIVRSVDDSFYHRGGGDSFRMRSSGAAVVSKVATLFAEADDIDGALAIVQGADGRLGFHALGRIAAAQIRAGDIDGALATARIIDYGPARGNTLLVIMSAQLKAGNIDGALATVESVDSSGSFVIRSSRVRDEKLHDIASMQARAGDFQGAMNTAMKIDARPDRVTALMGIAKYIATAEK